MKITCPRCQTDYDVDFTEPSKVECEECSLSWMAEPKPENLSTFQQAKQRIEDYENQPHKKSVTDKKAMSKAQNGGCLLIIFSFILGLFMGPFWWLLCGILGAVGGLIILANSFGHKKPICSECGNPVEETSMMCPHCKINFER